MSECPLPHIHAGDVLTPGIMGPEWMADEMARGNAHAAHVAQIRETATQEDAPRFDASEYRARMNRPAPRADLRNREPIFDYSDDGPGALFMMLVCVVITCAAIGAAWYFI